MAFMYNTIKTTKSTKMLSYTCHNVNLELTKKGYQNVAGRCDDFEDGPEHETDQKEI